MPEKNLSANNLDDISHASSDFIAYCEAEFERRSNSDTSFDEPHYRAAMQLAVDKLAQLAEC